MLALGVAASWLLLTIAVGLIWVTWGVLNIIGDAVERWQRHRKPRKEMEQSSSS